MKKILLFLFIPLTIYSQNNHLIISGLVIDKNHIQIENALITDETKEYYCISDSLGLFNLNINTEIHNLIITHLGYKTRIITINKNIYKKDSAYFLIQLEKKPVQLKEVEIYGNNTQIAYKNENVWVIDFEISKDGIYILTEKNIFTNKTVLLLNTDGDTIAYKTVNKRFKSFYKDFLGNILLLGTDSVYQLTNYKNNIRLTYPYSIDKLNPFFFSIVGNIGYFFIQQQFSNFNQTVTYFTINKKTKRKTVLQRITNEETAKSNRNYYENKMKRTNNLIKTGEITTTEELENIRKSIDDDLFFKLILSKPIYDPIKIIDNKVVLFDFEDNKITIYDSVFNILRNVFITFHHSKYWDNKILIDAANNKCYAKFIKSGIVTLKQINIKSGKVVNKIQLKHVFPQKIRINENMVYYMYHDNRAGISDKRYLYKYTLKN